eukprot:5284606-Heterocapsa_arctica.AAC.1
MNLECVSRFVGVSVKTPFCCERCGGGRGAYSRRRASALVTQMSGWRRWPRCPPRALGRLSPNGYRGGNILYA